MYPDPDPDPTLYWSGSIFCPFGTDDLTRMVIVSRLSTLLEAQLLSFPWDPMTTWKRCVAKSEGLVSRRLWGSSLGDLTTSRRFPPRGLRWPSIDIADQTSHPPAPWQDPFWTFHQFPRQWKWPGRMENSIGYLSTIINKNPKNIWN